MTTAVNEPGAGRRPVPGGNVTSDEQAIRDVVATWLAASAAGDDAKVLSLMSDEVVFLTIGNPPMTKAAVAAGLAALKAHRGEGASDIQEVRVSGSLAVCWSHLTVAMTPRAGGSTVRRAGHVLSVLEKRADGAWVFVRDANLLSVVPS